MAYFKQHQGCEIQCARHVYVTGVTLLQRKHKMIAVHLGTVMQSFFLAGFRKKKAFMLIANPIVYQYLLILLVLCKQVFFSNAHCTCCSLRAVLPMGLRSRNYLPCHRVVEEDFSGTSINFSLLG